MTDANSISKGSTLTYAAISGSIIEGGKCSRLQAQQLSEFSSVFLALRKISFSLQRVLGHALTLAYGPGCLLENLACDGRAVFGKRDRQCAYEPVLEHSDAADGVLIAIVEVLEKVGFPGQWQVALESEKYALEGNVVFRPISAVARKVNVNAAPAQLRTQIAEREKLICPEHYVKSLLSGYFPRRSHNASRNNMMQPLASETI
jgi:hypothetical protein